ncbi:MAG: relaxase domain-containing protein [Acidimicrobiales bacterium]
MQPTSEPSRSSPTTALCGCPATSSTALACSTGRAGPYGYYTIAPYFIERRTLTEKPRAPRPHPQLPARPARLARDLARPGTRVTAARQHRELKTACMAYHAALRAELTARLGVAWGPADRHGKTEVAGVPEGLRGHYSGRRAAVQAAASVSIAESEVELGRGLTAAERRRAYERAVLVTRYGKAHDPASTQGLHDRWAAEADTAGFEPASWLPGHAGTRHIGHHVIDPERIVAEALDELERTHSTWDEPTSPARWHVAWARGWVTLLTR